MTGTAFVVNELTLYFSLRTPQLHICLPEYESEAGPTTANYIFSMAL